MHSSAPRSAPRPNSGASARALQWQLGGTGHPWFLYAFAGWGVGLVAHYAVTRETAGGGGGHDAAVG